MSLLVLNRFIIWVVYLFMFVNNIFRVFIFFCIYQWLY